MLIDKKKNVQSRLSKLTFSVFIFFQNLVVRLCRLKKKKNLPGNDQFDCYFLFQTVRVLGLLRGWGLVIMTFEWSFMSFQWVTLTQVQMKKAIIACMWVSFRNCGIGIWIPRNYSSNFISLVNIMTFFLPKLHCLAKNSAFNHAEVD